MSKTSLIVILIILLVGAFLVSNKNIYNNENKAQGEMNNTQATNGNIQVIPIEHATMVLKWGDKVVYADPVGGANAFIGQPAPDVILLTHAHPDHFDVKTLEAVSKPNTLIIAPMSVADLLPSTVPGVLLVMKNGQKTNQKTSKEVNLYGFSVEAIPAYNLPEKNDSYHKKGDGNGYVIEAGGRRVYVSGDTSNTPEMQNLKNIDIAFVSMNLPYTMGVEDAALGVLAFKPKQVYPYHYRGTNGLSDVNKFKTLVNKDNPNIDVVLLNWYPN